MLLSPTDQKKSYKEAPDDFCAHITRLPGRQANAISRYLEPGSPDISAPAKLPPDAVGKFNLSELEIYLAALLIALRAS